MSTASSIARLRERLRSEATPRALAGLAALGVILAVVVLGDMSRMVSESRERVADLQRQKGLQEALLSGEDWSGRAEQAEAARREARSRFWRGETNGIVAARLQGAVEAAAREAGIERARVAVEQNPEPLGAGAVVFEIALSGSDRSGQFLALYQTLSRTEAYLSPSSFSWNRNNGRLELTILAPAVVAGREDVGSVQEAAAR